MNDLKIAQTKQACAVVDICNDIILCLPNVPIDCDTTEIYYKGKSKYTVRLFEFVLSLLEHETLHIVVESVCDRLTSKKLDNTDLERERLFEYERI